MEDETKGAVAAPYARGPMAGSLTAPASKSLTQRALVAAAMAGSGSMVHRPLDAEDTRLLFAALRAAGHALEWSGDSVRAAGPAPAREGRLLFGNNGTGLRFAVAQLAAIPGHWVVDGAPRLRERPIAPLVKALRGLGALIEPASAPRLPLRIAGRSLRGGTATLDASSSSQFVSALLLLGARLPEGLAIRLTGQPPSRPYVALTVEVLRAFGAQVESRDDDREYAVVSGGLRAAAYTVEGDWSAAAFPLAAAAVAGGRVEVRGVRDGSAQGDAIVARLLAGCGCRCEATAGGLAFEGPARRALSADLRDAPDLFPALAVVVARVGGRLEGLAGLEGKESPRLTVMADRLTRLGFEVEAGADWFAARAARGGPAPRDPLDPADDHRIAMALAVAGTVVAGVRIASPACVAKSWPTFWRDWQGLCGGRG